MDSAQIELSCSWYTESVDPTLSKDAAVQLKKKGQSRYYDKVCVFFSSFDLLAFVYVVWKSNWLYMPKII